MTGSGAVLVTGAAGGIGEGIVRALLSEGFKVLAQGRSMERLGETFGSMDGLTLIEHDLVDAESAATWLKTVIGEHGPLGGFVHAAGFDRMAPIYLSKPAQTRELFEIHALVPIAMAGVLAKRGQAAPGCSIVLISSVAAHEGAAGHSAYAAVKGALEGFLRPGAAELGARGIRMNVIAPGVVRTAMSAGFLGRMNDEQLRDLENSYPLGVGEPSDIAQPVVFLVSDRSRWITGQIIIADGGHLARSV